MTRYSILLILLTLGAAQLLAASEKAFASFTLPSSRHVQGRVLIPEKLADRMLIIAEVERDDPGREAYRRLGALGAEHQELVCILNLRLRAHMSEAYGFHQSTGLARGSRVSLYQNASIPGNRPDSLPWLWIVAADGALVWSGPAANGWDIVERVLSTPEGIIPPGRLWQHLEAQVEIINSDAVLRETLAQLRGLIDDGGEAASEAETLLGKITAWRDGVLADAAGERRLLEPTAVEEALDTAVRRLAGDSLAEPLSEARRTFTSDREVRDAKRAEADLMRIITAAEEHQLTQARDDDPHNAQGRAQLERAFEQFLRRHRDRPIAERAQALRQEWGL